MKTANVEFKRLFILGAFIVSLFWGLQNIEYFSKITKVLMEAFSPVILGMIIAFCMNMPMDFFERRVLCKVKMKKGLKRIIALLISFFLIVAIVFVVIFMVVPQLGRTVYSIANSFPQYLEKTESLIIQITDKFPEINDAFNNLNFDKPKMIQSIISYFQSIGTGLINSTVSVVGTIFSGVMKLFLGLVFCFYMLINRETLLHQGRAVIFALLPKEKAHYTLAFLRLTTRTFHNFIGGQCTEAVILGCMFAVSMTIFNFPYALLIGVLVGFTALIPIVGSFIGCGVGGFLIFMENPVTAFWFVLLFLVLQQVEGNFIYPKVVGNSVGLPSMWVLIAVTVGGSLKGIVGMLIFIPVFSVIYTVWGKFIETRLKKKEIGKEILDD